MPYFLNDNERFFYETVEKEIEKIQINGLKLLDTFQSEKTIILSIKTGSELKVIKIDLNTIEKDIKELKENIIEKKEEIELIIKKIAIKFLF
jgi:hypothetical protein